MERVTPDSGALAVLGIKLTDWGPAFADAEMLVGAENLNQQGSVQGGVYAVFADAAAGWATEAALGSPRYVTMDYSCNLLGAAGEGDLLRARASLVHRGRRTVVVNVEVDRLRDSAEPRRVAWFTCTQLVFEGPPAQ
ncbi:PaaI family thioesterase [Arthrobacter sp. NPDC056727]|uniref:PaaI family thioesterase n=1 Tax=Arthrobacter sp. NPDC056727 TaxID=3345927 RepID=UPI00366B1248